MFNLQSDFTTVVLNTFRKHQKGLPSEQTKTKSTVVVEQAPAKAKVEVKSAPPPKVTVLLCLFIERNNK